VHADAPVGRDDDRLGRRPFAQLIARQVTLQRPTDGLVIAVAGDWGAGKTSVLRMVKEELTDPVGAAIPATAARLVVLEFNPWLFGGSEQLTALFFLQLAEQLPDDVGGGRAGALADRLRRYGTALGVLRSLPGIGGLFAVGADLADAAARRIDPAALDLTARRREVAEALRDLGAHVVVLIDDVDRLQSASEIRDLMRMVKLVGDLPGVTYVLSYDRRPIVAALSDAGISGHEYLEKIVQVEYQLPAPARDRLNTMLGEELDAAIVDVPQERLEEGRWGEVFKSVVEPLIDTPRHVRRYSNAVRLALDLHGEEVDLVDQLALTAIATFLPSLHTRLAELADALFPKGVAFSLLLGEQERDAAKARLEQAADESGERDVALAAFRLLFPATARVLNSGSSDHSGEHDARRRRRVADPEAFWTYLTAALPTEALGVAEVRAALDAMADEDRIVALFTGRDVPALGRLFERLRVHVKELDPAVIPVAVRTIATSLQEATRGRAETVNDPRLRVVWFVVDLLTRLPTDERHTLLMRWAEEEPTAEGKLGVYEIGHYETEGQVLIGADNLIELEGQIAAVVCGMPADELLALDHAGRLLYRTDEYLRERDLPALLELLDRDDRIFLRYLLVFTERSLDDGPRLLDWARLTDVLGTEWLSARLDRVAAEAEYPDTLAAVLTTARRRAADAGQRGDTTDANGGDG
jgi:hypothetical protein